MPVDQSVVWFHERWIMSDAKQLKASLTSASAPKAAHLTCILGWSVEAVIDLVAMTVEGDGRSHCRSLCCHAAACPTPGTAARATEDCGEAAAFG